MNIKAEMRMIYLQVEEHLRLPANNQTPERGTEQFVPHSSQKKPTHKHLSPRTVRQNISAV